MSTVAGRLAEDIASQYLEHQGFSIIAKNWRTRWCEIDIVAQKSHKVYFVEVKYRNKNDWGMGLDYLTPRKMRQMRFAAEFWVTANNWAGNYKLGAIGLLGDPPLVEEWIPDIE